MRVRTLALFLLFSVCFLSVGYAAISAGLSARIDVSAEPIPKGVLIVAVEVVEERGATDVGSTYTLPTNLRMTVNAQNGGSITYRITVENRSDVTHWYRSISYVKELADTKNALIGTAGGITVKTKDKLADTTATFHAEDWVPPHSTRDFYVVYSFGANAVGEVTTFINFAFGERIASYGDDILAILNDPVKYGTLSGAFDAAYAENGTTVLGNVGADQEFMESLFGVEMKLDGKPVTLMIERSNVDGKTTGDSFATGNLTGCEYTIYVTTDSTTSGTPTVYAVSYTREADGTWVQIGELYEGTTSLGAYVDSTGKSHSSFDPDTWAATPNTYTVFTYKGQSVTYKVNQKYGNSYQQQFKLEDLMSMRDQELYNQLNNHQIMKDAYEILFVSHAGSEAPEILLLREAYDDALRFYQMRNSGKEFTLDNTATRAELLSTVEALARAMDYYQQVHDTNH